MSLLSHSHAYDFFKNKELNQIYLSIAITTFGDALISIFVPIYLYKLGYSIPLIILFYFLVSLSFIIFSYSGARIVSKIGAKHSILCSAPFLICYYLGLRLLGEQPLLFFVLPFVLSWRAVLYNYGYHLNFVTHAERKDLGKEISFIGILGVIASIMAPLIGGIIAQQSFELLYVVGATVVVIGVVPLFFTKDTHERLNFTAPDMLREIFSKKERGTLISFSGYAIESIIGRVIWPIFLITILITIQKTGLIVMLSMLSSLIVFLGIGKLTDRFDRVRLLRLGTLLYFFAWVGRIFANSAFRILAIDSYKNLSEKVLQVPWSAHSYDLAIREGYFRFIVDREVIFNLSRVVFMPLLGVIFLIGVSPFAMSFIMAAIFSIGYIFINRN